jgi:phosphate transport system permease protein
MRSSALLLALAAIVTTSYFGGRSRALAVAGGRLARLKALPVYHGAYAALAAAVPGLIFLIAALMVEPWAVSQILDSSLPEHVRQMAEGSRALWMTEVHRYLGGDLAASAAAPEVVVYGDQLRALHRSMTIAIAGGALGLGAVGAIGARRRITVDFAARARVEAVIRAVMGVAATMAVLTTIGIVLSLVFETLRFFGRVPLTEFIFGLRWSPQTALRADQVGASGAFGAVPLFAGTLLITGIAMCVAVPLGLLSAVYTSEYASARARGAVKPLLEVLAGVPTVVYGFFAALTVAPALRELGTWLGLDVASESALAAGAVMGIMIIPFISSLSDDVMNAVPQSLRDGAYALGATKSETIRQIVLPAALPGIAGAVLLAISRAIGETMIVVMAAGLAANLTLNPFAAVTTVTVQIVTLLVGDQEFDSAKTLAAFALGLVLFFVTLCLNIGALAIVRRYREQYE